MMERESGWSKERVILCVLSPAVLCVLLSVARGGVSRTEVSTYRVHFACDLVSLSECRVEVWWRERSGVKGGKGVERMSACAGVTRLSVGIRHVRESRAECV